MRSLTSTLLRFVGSVATALGLSGALVYGTALVLPQVVDVQNLAVWKLPTWLIMQTELPGKDRRILEQIRHLEFLRQAKDEIVYAVMKGEMTELDARTAFEDLIRKDSKFHQRLEISYPQETESERARLHFERYYEALGGELAERASVL